MSQARVFFEERGPVAVVKMDDGKANAIQEALLDELGTALDRVQDGEARAVVLTGRGGFFSGGLDLKTLPGLEPDALRAVLRQFCATVLRLFTFPRPVVAALGGHAVAGGMVMALAADHRVMAKGPFKVGLNETAIGLPPPAFVVELARAALPPTRLLTALAHATMSTGPEALEHGWVHEQVAADALLDHAVQIATTLCRLDPEAYRHAKTLVREPHARGFEARFDQEIETFMARIGKQ